MLSPQLLGKTEALIQSGLSLQTSVLEGSTELLAGNTGPGFTKGLKQKIVITLREKS